MLTDNLRMTISAYKQYRTNNAYSKIGNYDVAFIHEVYSEKCTNCGKDNPVDGRAFCQICIDKEIKHNYPTCDDEFCNICIWRNIHKQKNNTIHSIVLQEE